MTPGAGQGPSERVLVVCTANRCRSPLAAALLREALDVRTVGVEVRTAGLLDDGLPATEATVAVAARRGVDLGGHRSARVDPTDVSAADLVIGMERLHVREAVLAVPEAWPRAFTLKELVRRGEAVGPRSSHESLATWLARLHEGRRRQEVLGASPLDDVADPAGHPIGEHEDLARELEQLVGLLVQLAWPDDTEAAP